MEMYKKGKTVRSIRNILEEKFGNLNFFRQLCVAGRLFAMLIWDSCASTRLWRPCRKSSESGVCAWCKKKVLANTGSQLVNNVNSRYHIYNLIYIYTVTYI